MRGRDIFAWIAVLLLAPPARAHAADDAAAALFRQSVVPVLERRCVSCHSGEHAKGGLGLESREKALAGGDSGPAIVPDKPGESLLVDHISGEKPEMPKEGPPLAAAEVAAIRRWIEGGAYWPDGVKLVDKKAPGPWWSLEPLVRRPAPAIESPWIRTPIDAFVLAKLDEHGLRRAPAADRRTLLRRLSFDLVGLPPEPAEVEAFLSDEAPDAYERQVDRLLASPRYGERWGRHWLDVVHYGESHGYDKDKPRANAWPYRDYVIAAFNSDKRYSRFVLEQLAGDVLFPDDPQATVATGFVAAGPWDFVGHTELREGTVDKAIARSNDRDDMVMTAMSTFVSMTVHCARCHNHKFDPIAQQDYYRLQAVFGGVDRADRPYRGADGTEKLVYALKSIEPRPVYVLARGDVKAPGEPASPGALECVKGLPREFALADAANEGSRRAALARWIADPANVLARRSIVNRVWHYHFGAGLVDTPNDFGRMGSPPSHPELLDWLAVEFLEQGESLKKLHKLIVTSNVYRQASTGDAENEKRDAGNRYLWRANRRRLDAEAIRDAVLATSGKLDLTMGGPSVRQFAFKDDHSPVYDYARFDVDDPAAWRRSVYRFIVRSVPDPLMECLDCPDPSLLAPKRNTTLTALQALALMNNALFVRQAEHFAARVREMSADPASQIDAAYRLALARPPRAEEAQWLTEYAARHGLANACRLIFNSNEFVFVD
ncbi:MAG: PSD1 domain-containing protein [Planctomycetia bacterium]|nr:PSD1 domain-containing protein [Planctomycetia bacterium]